MRIVLLVLAIAGFLVLEGALTPSAEPEAREDVRNPAYTPNPAELKTADRWLANGQGHAEATRIANDAGGKPVVATLVNGLSETRVAVLGCLPGRRCPPGELPGDISWGCPPLTDFVFVPELALRPDWRLGDGLTAQTRAARKLIEPLRPDVVIWFHQAETPYVAASGASIGVTRRYARVVGVPLEQRPAGFSPAPTSRDPLSGSFVVGQPSNPGRRAGTSHANAMFWLGNLRVLRER